MNAFSRNKMNLRCPISRKSHFHLSNCYNTESCGWDKKLLGWTLAETRYRTWFLNPRHSSGCDLGPIQIYNY